MFVQRLPLKVSIDTQTYLILKDIPLKKYHFGYTSLKFNIAPENLPSQKERIVFQLSFFRGELLNFEAYLLNFRWV